ncbi:MAG TPA: hypothetical protein VFT90_16920 [Chryseosolibacter sp.]|nr:hypothetical protein [Chryseosolibacter sp.]
MRVLTAGLFLLLFTACGSGNKSEEQAFAETLDHVDLEQQVISGEVNDILHRIPSPLEISVLLKESGKKYNGSFLNAPDNASRYNTNYKKALNLGIYGTDLGYTNIYEQSQDGIRYMSTIRDLANELNIGQFFETETIGRLVSNSNNLDSLLLITTQNFNNINSYLQSQNRSHLSVLLLTGGWLEALHITCEVAKSNPDNAQLKETIGAQKIILDNILHLLSFYKENDRNMASLLTDMQALKQSFDKVTITTVYKPSTYEVVDGVMVVKDNSSSTVEITKADIDSIRSTTQNIRTKIIS